MSTLKKSILLLMSLLLILVAYNSLHWRIEHDSPILLYATFLIDRYHYIPYKDILDFNMPGAYFAYYLIGRVSDYADPQIRHIDLLILMTILVMSWFWMRSAGREVAWCGSVLWGLLYLAYGPTMSLQREYLILVPILAAILAFAYVPTSKPIWRSLLVGFFWGIAAAMKPHAAIGFALHALLEFWDVQQDAHAIGRKLRAFLGRFAIPAMVGFSLPIFVTLWYLWSTNAISSFLDVATNYWPLYNNLTGWNMPIAGLNRVEYLITSYLLFGGFIALLISAAVGVHLSLAEFTDSQKRLLFTLIGFACLYSIYPVIAGKFWKYHWLFFLYFVVQLSALCLINRKESTPKRQQILPIIILILAMMITMPRSNFRKFLLGEEVSPPKQGRVDEIAKFLQQNLQPGDTVQPLDWTGGAIHAMLISGARIATPFIYDFHFYHHISNPYIQTLRHKFVAALEESSPRFIIQITSLDKPWVSGADTTREFAELESVIDEEYRIVSKGNGYIIYESKISIAKH